MTAPAWLIATLLLVAVTASARAANDTGIDDPEPAARDCRVAARSTPATDLWWTVFYGEREKTIGKSRVREWTREVRCFIDAKSCMAWRDWAASRWPDHGYPRPCLAGLPAWLQGPDA